MNFIVFTLVALLTFIISQFAMTQIIGIVLFKLPRREFNYLFAVFVWAIILIIIYFIITKWLNAYFNVYLAVTVISFIIALLNIKNLKDEK